MTQDDTLRAQAFPILSPLQSGTELVVRLDAALDALAAERERCARIVDPGALEPWEARGGAEGIELMRDLAAAIRGA